MKHITSKVVVAFVAVSVSVAALSGAALAASKHGGNERSGWGKGDKNHVHVGPSGHSVHPGDGDNDSDDHGSSNGHNDGHKDDDKKKNDDKKNNDKKNR